MMIDIAMMPTRRCGGLAFSFRHVPVSPCPKELTQNIASHSKPCVLEDSIEGGK